MVKRARRRIRLVFLYKNFKKEGESMQEKEMELLERLTANEQRAKSNTHRLDKMEPIVNEIHTMSNTMVQLVEEIKHTNETVSSLDEKVERMDSRVDIMERAPAEDLKAYRRTAAASIISAIAGAAAAGILAMAVNFI